MYILTQRLVLNVKEVEANDGAVAATPASISLTEIQRHKLFLSLPEVLLKNYLDVSP